MSFYSSSSSNPLYKSGQSGAGAVEIKPMQMDRSPTNPPVSSNKNDAANYVVTGESFLGSLDPLNCCPSKSQIVDKSLYNRMLLCFFAICLTWCSSVKVATIIASSFISTPIFATIYDSCNTAFQVTTDQSDAYTACVEAQLSFCYEDLQAAATAESNRASTAANLNAKRVTEARNNQSSCSNAFTMTSTSLQTWASTNNVPLPYLPTCSQKHRDKINKATGDISAPR